MMIGDYLRFYVPLNSTSVLSGRWDVDNARLCAMELRLRMRRFRLMREWNSVRQIRRPAFNPLRHRGSLMTGCIETHWQSKRKGCENAIMIQMLYSSMKRKSLLGSYSRGTVIKKLTIWLTYLFLNVTLSHSNRIKALSGTSVNCFNCNPKYLITDLAQLSRKSLWR